MKVLPHHAVWSLLKGPELVNCKVAQELYKSAWRTFGFMVFACTHASLALQDTKQKVGWREQIVLYKD